MSLFKKLYIKIQIKYFNLMAYRYWEFWPSWLFYIPIGFYYVFFMIKYRIGIKAIAAVNPCFAFGGMAFDSKYDMISKFFSYPEYVAKTILITERDISNILQKVNAISLDYPFICKPDRGHRGNGFKIIKNESDLKHYLTICDRPFLIQEYIDYPMEYGVFWIKYPNEIQGKITSITRKVLPYLKGNGKSKLSELILSDKRARHLAKIYFEKNKNYLEEIISENEEYRICSAGNHCQGAIFEDGQDDLTSETLEKLIEICSSVKGYDFGRMDIKFKDKDSLSNGKNFKILEVNGSEAESTHIYDRKNSLFYAYKTLYYQWDSLFRIAKQNRESGYYGLSGLNLFRSYIDFFKENKEIKSD